MNRDPWAWRIDSGGFRRGANRRIALAMIDEDGIRQRWESMGCKLDERGRRLFAANEVQAAGYGSLAIVSRITGIARSTINRGEDDLDEGPLPEGRVRRKGGGGKPLAMSDPTVVDDLRRLVEPVTVGLPEQPLRWVSKSREKLSLALNEMGHTISANTVAKLLAGPLGFSRQHNRKAEEGSNIPTGTRNSSTSTRKSWRPRPPDSRSSRSIRRKRSWLETIRTAARIIGRKAIQCA